MQCTTIRILGTAAAQQQQESFKTRTTQVFFGLLLLGCCDCERGQTLVEEGSESESFFTLDFLRRRARSDMVMLPMAGTRGLWLRIASNVAETALCKGTLKVFSLV